MRELEGEGMLWRLLMKEIVGEACAIFRLERAYRGENKEQQYKGKHREIIRISYDSNESFPTWLGGPRSSFESLIAGESYCS